MSFDLPANIERDLEKYARSENISPAEAALKLIQDALRSKKREVKKIIPLTDDELATFDKAFPTLNIADVSDDQWQRIEKGNRKVRREGLPHRA